MVEGRRGDVAALVEGGKRSASVLAVAIPLVSTFELRVWQSGGLKAKVVKHEESSSERNAALRTYQERRRHGRKNDGEE